MVTVIFYTCNHTTTHITTLEMGEKVKMIFSRNRTTAYTTAFGMGENGDSDLLPPASIP